jgi:dethiobiotin synthetase
MCRACRAIGDAHEPRRIVVTGTDTDIGKTVFAPRSPARWALPIGSRSRPALAEGTDSATAARRAVPTDLARSLSPEAPLLAASCGGDRRHLDRYRRGWRPESTAAGDRRAPGGVLVPVTPDCCSPICSRAGASRWCSSPAPALGTINHSLLSIEALRARGVPILGIAFVGDPVRTAKRRSPGSAASAASAACPVSTLDARTLAAAFAAHFHAADFA